ncbi:hypothetical protein QTP86_029764, partial [Hemibagrus guttatus]
KEFFLATINSGLLIRGTYQDPVQDTCPGYTLDRVPTHHRAHTHTRGYYGQFRDANQPTMHVFGPGEETGVPGGNPQGTGRTCKLHTHGRGGNRTPNPGDVRQTGPPLVHPWSTPGPPLVHPWSTPGP